MPVRAAAGATFRYSRGQVELDVRCYGAEDQYELLSSDSTGVRIFTLTGGAPAISAAAFSPVLHQARSIVSYALGANYSLSPALRLHAGFFTDPSPVSGPSRSTFRAVDLTGVSGGVSLGSGRLTGIGRRFQLLGNDHGPGGRPDLGWGSGDNRCEHPDLHGPLRGLLHILRRGGRPGCPVPCTKVQWSQPPRRTMV